MTTQTNKMTTKYVFLLCFAGCLWGAQPSERAAKLEQLKKEFPACTVPLSDSIDPHILICYRTWKKRGESVSVETLAEDVVELRALLHNDIRDMEIQRADGNRILRTDTKAAIAKNIAWLRNRVSPWLDRLAALQRGR